MKKSRKPCSFAIHPWTQLGVKPRPSTEEEVAGLQKDFPLVSPGRLSWKWQSCSRPPAEGSRFLHDNEFDKSLASVVIKATVPVSDVLLIVEGVTSEEARGESG